MVVQPYPIGLQICICQYIKLGRKLVEGDDARFIEFFFSQYPQSQHAGGLRAVGRLGGKLIEQVLAKAVQSYSYDTRY